jgi:hypothetical protein
MIRFCSDHILFISCHFSLKALAERTDEASNILLLPLWWTVMGEKNTQKIYWIKHIRLSVGDVDPFFSWLFRFHFSLQSRKKLKSKKILLFVITLWMINKRAEKTCRGLLMHEGKGLFCHSNISWLSDEVFAYDQHEICFCWAFKFKMIKLRVEKAQKGNFQGCEKDEWQTKLQIISTILLIHS